MSHLPPATPSESLDNSGATSRTTIGGSAVVSRVSSGVVLLPGSPGHAPRDVFDRLFVGLDHGAILALGYHPCMREDRVLVDAFRCGSVVGLRRLPGRGVTIAKAALNPDDSP